jgi:AcrR family transcriptional regulator
MARRRRLELDERRAQLLALAQAAFATTSYDDGSIDHLAQAAGVSKGLLYHYFPSKRDLYLATVREAAEQLLQRIVPDPSLAPREQLTRGLDAYLRYAQDNADAFLSLMQSGIGRDREVYAIVEAARQRFAQIVLARLGETPRSAVQRVLVHGWVGMVEAASLDWLKQPELQREALARALSETLLHALSLDP